EGARARGMPRRTRLRGPSRAGAAAGRGWRAGRRRLVVRPRLSRESDRERGDLRSIRAHRRASLASTPYARHGDGPYARAPGRGVEVRISDRGPFVDGRAIDLSYAAARTIGMIGPGTSRVRIDVLGKAPPPPIIPPPRDLPTGVYTVEVASLSDPGKAQHLRQ